MFELTFNNLFSKKKRIDKILRANHELVDWLLSNHPSFLLVFIFHKGSNYMINIEPSMKEWGMSKLEEMGLVHGFSIKEFKTCTCECHRGAELLEDPGCCDYAGIKMP